MKNVDIIVKQILVHKTIRRVLVCLAIIIAIAVILYLIPQGRSYFSRRTIRQMGASISSHGILAPFFIIFLIFLSTAIPPLPLPVPLIEITAGLLFGFFPGFLTVWIGQILASVFAFFVTRILGKRFLRKFLSNKYISPYGEFVRKKGPLAVIMIRATMSAPFNIISFISGLTEMTPVTFTFATALGTIPEAALFAFIGTILKTTRIRLSYVFIFLVILGFAGPVMTYFILKFFHPPAKNHLKPNPLIKDAYLKRRFGTKGHNRKLL